MNAVLPDVSRTEVSSRLLPLDWVGMQGIDLPVTLDEPGERRTVHARADVHVDLPQPQVKGIHMSRLYRLLDSLGEGTPLAPGALRALLQEMVSSHEDCGSQSARLALHFDFLARRPALVTEGLAGWKSYPVRLQASLTHGVFRLNVRVTVGYSSTCPCSAALSRQLVQQAFLDTYAGQTLSAEEVASWLQSYATLATPHSQRSEAEVDVTLEEGAAGLGLLQLVDEIEQALGTPVQTAVKRADEQAFAALNGQNLMFVEDAARRIQSAPGLAGLQPQVYVRHIESLHPHDAVAWASGATKRDAPSPTLL